MVGATLHRGRGHAQSFRDFINRQSSGLEFLQESILFGSPKRRFDVSVRHCTRSVDEPGVAIAVVISMLPPSSRSIVFDLRISARSKPEYASSTRTSNAESSGSKRVP